LFARPQPAREMEKIYNQVFAVDGMDV
ncbi:MAG: hypothetical protein PWP20_1561, partial [Eubacteriaceae bacterium]|nr:hypothetical protein [Eubacteriaceae bacterium]